MAPPSEVGRRDTHPGGTATKTPALTKTNAQPDTSANGHAKPMVSRTVFATSRAAEFLELRALQAQTGQPVDAFGDVVIKELIDNALDAAETASRAPVVEIQTSASDGVVYITVADNGAGITPDTVTKLCDFTVLVSDKARYRGPARGAQGNAFKTLLGIPFALLIMEPVVIESHGVRHELRVTEQFGAVEVIQESAPSDRVIGTSVTVPLPDDLEIDPERWAYAAALVNPHASITVVDQAHAAGRVEPVFYKPSDVGWSKWTPSMPSSPHWYDRAAFTALIYSYIHEIDCTGIDVPLGRFITEFDGLSGSVKQKAIRTAAPGITHLSGLDGRNDVIAALHDAMLHHAKPTPAGRLGSIGEDHYERLLDDTYGVLRVWYKMTTAVADGVPWVIEVAVADTIDPGSTWFACNHAPAFDDPLGRAFLSAGDINTFGAGSFLAAADADDTSSGGNRAAVVHVICAAPQFVDKGKVALVVPESVRIQAAKALDGATKTLHREAEQRRKDARKADRIRQQALKAERENRWSIKDAVFEVLLEAKEAAGREVAARTLFYKVRPLVQDYTDAELNYSYFTQTLLPEYERTVAPLPGLYYEARGALHHPHDGATVPLGTREVEAYIPPSWQFDKILYVEKKGLEAQLAPYQLGERYDMAIIYGQGYSPTACRNLLARSDIREMTIFVLHDADINGYNIARTLGEATRRMPYHSVDVIDLGLTVPQAIDFGLETEAFTRRMELPADLELDDDALEWFTGEPFQAGYNKVHYKCTRCELNAFSADELAEYIEAGLQTHGAATKVMPPSDVLAEHAELTRDEILADLVAQVVDIDGVVHQVVASHPNLIGVHEERVRAGFTDAPAKSWRSVVEGLVLEDINAKIELEDTIRAHLLERLSALENDEEPNDE